MSAGDAAAAQSRPAGSARPPVPALDAVTDLDGDLSHLDAIQFAKVMRVRLRAAVAGGDVTLPEGGKLYVRTDYAIPSVSVVVIITGVTYEQAHGDLGTALAEAISPFCRGWARSRYRHVQIMAGPTAADATTQLAVLGPQA